ncbi:MAG: CBS domain-containing protein [Chloroflexi bacterium]|nr:CBS domain-containing protein [Chloroflexota bacterium]
MTRPQLVRDLMTVGVPTCAASTPVSDVARLLLDLDLEAVAVLDREGHAAGVISQYELVQVYTRDGWQSLTAEQVMREDVPQIPPEIPLTAAIQIMQDQGVRVLFLMHHSDGISYPAAVITYRHVLRLLAARDQTELKDLGIHAAREAPLDTFIKRRDAARQRAIRPPEE